MLNGHRSASLTQADRSLIEAAQQGINEAEAALSWQGPPHRVLKIEGLAADGIDPDAARLAARAATKALIEG